MGTNCETLFPGILKVSNRREILRHQHKLDEIKSIMNAMKNLAFLETRKVAQHLDNQQKMVTDVEQLAADFLTFYPQLYDSREQGFTLWILFGSERGFCGDFNQALLTRLGELRHRIHDTSAASSTSDPVILVGSKLHALSEDDIQPSINILGAEVAEEILAVLTNIVANLSELQSQYSPNGLQLNVNVLYQDMQTQGIKTCELMPPFQQTPEFTEDHHAPMITLGPKHLYGELVQQYLFIALQEIAYMSLMTENHRRVQYLDGATRYLDKSSQQLTHRYQQLRQEEITEEIEVILLNAEGN